MLRHDMGRMAWRNCKDVQQTDRQITTMPDSTAEPRANKEGQGAAEQA
ncbi:hypothetical protein E5Q_01423 [Mixia osmundae IAM 14324]|uniref:Uncharacterized protein n=1 Tax=Mixia osmundae (strain CBS 9802 / IAM 14324 / JCM 22182 / KY 12970) TaxID=764103 RepID=G7DW81_MIXOS|nr:hypothetical protein E5Q_01423 [Mixia osmundae IAM 14324]